MRAFEELKEEIESGAEKVDLQGNNDNSSKKPFACPFILHGIS